VLSELSPLLGELWTWLQRILFLELMRLLRLIRERESSSWEWVLIELMKENHIFWIVLDKLNRKSLIKALTTSTLPLKAILVSCTSHLNLHLVLIVQLFSMEGMLLVKLFPEPEHLDLEWSS
jgi:hypothetical protein